MKTMGSFEAKTHFSALLEQVAQGEEFLITRHGQPVARLVSANKETQTRKLHAIQRLKGFNQSTTLNGLDWKLLRDEGRRS